MITGQISMRGISKRYPGVVALDGVSIDIAAGETHALIGENGAGKSTLMKILAGAIAPDGGEISFDGAPQSYASMTPRLSRALGIEIMYQEFNLLPTLTVAENIYISDLPGTRGILNRRAMSRNARELLAQLEVAIDPDAIVETLSVAQMQLVEIAKAVHRNVRILVMDEPTAPLTNAETETLFRIVDDLKSRGVTIIYISHRLGEIFRLADRVTILRDGTKIGDYDIGALTRESMIRGMVGRDIPEGADERRDPADEVVLRVKNLAGGVFQGVDFGLRRGEVLGIFGLVGAGRTEVARVLFGADARAGGSVFLNGQELALRNPRAAVRAGIVLVPEDRKHHGVIQSMSIGENIALPNMGRITRGGVLRPREESAMVDEQMSALQVAAPSSAQLVQNLSGGNQQKIVLAKWLAGSAKVLILDEPTRGVDVGAKHEIYRLIDELCEQGLSILMISSEMEEIIKMSDRILVLCEGQQTGIVERSEFTQERLLTLASSSR